MLGALGALGATACVDQVARRPQVPTATARATLDPLLADPLLADPALGIWPAAFQNAPERVREAYRYAIARPQTLRWFPCFCGCVNEGHQNNVDCFVRTRLATGRVILDTHGFG